VAGASFSHHAQGGGIWPGDEAYRRACSSMGSLRKPLDASSCGLLEGVLDQLDDSVGVESYNP
jgi:hypothetical protein